MDWIKQYKLEQADNGEYELVIYLNENNTEFADENGSIREEKQEDLLDRITLFIKEKLPEYKIKAVKVLLGGVVLATLPFASPAQAATPQNISSQTYQVQTGDSLWRIANQFGTNVDTIRSLNDLTNDTIYVNQVIKVPGTSQMYTVKSGDTLYKIANNFNITINQLKENNNLTGDTIHSGQTLNISNNKKIPTQSYTVKSGDSLWKVASQFGVSVNSLKNHNNLTSDIINVGQNLNIPTKNKVETPTTEPYVTYATHTVKSGDNPWSIALDYGIPVEEVLEANNLSRNSSLTLGQTLKIPVHHIPVKEAVSEQHGELLDWWTEARYVFATNDTATVTDFETGRTFNIKRTTGANHADSETLTARDTEVARDIWGGYSWQTRPVIINVDGRNLAASMSFMPHDVEYIDGNNISGHFDVHFLNSTRHKDGEIDLNHQEDIKIAAGVIQS
ncbi:MAG: LysM peptidoglycan-binding domain-containing protein [Eubacteriales bacterium]